MRFGIAFTAGPYTESKLFHIAYAFEQLWNIEIPTKLYVQPKTELGDVVDGGESLKSL
jgi:amidase